MQFLVNSNPISIGDALAFSAIGLSIVFLVLIFIMVVIYIMSLFFKKNKTKPENAKQEPAVAAAAPAPAPVAATGEPARGSCGGIKLHGIEDKTAAMIMAIVADQMHTPLNELRFISIEEVKGDR